MNASISWKTLQLVITSSTVGDVEKMILKLITFFKVNSEKWNDGLICEGIKDQLRSSKMMWETAIAETNRDMGKEEKNEKEDEDDQHAGLFIESRHGIYDR